MTSDPEAMIALVRDPERDLLALLKHAPGKTILRAALLLADHDANDVGQRVVPAATGLRWRW